jgi:hypothetical protein
MVIALRTTLAAAAIAAATFTAGTTVGSTDAEARRGHVRIGFHGGAFHGYPYRHLRPYHFAPIVVGGYYAGDGCGWLRRRAHATGSPYWFHRYRMCIGGY